MLHELIIIFQHILNLFQSNENNEEVHCYNNLVMSTYEMLLNVKIVHINLKTKSTFRYTHTHIKKCFAHF